MTGVADLRTRHSKVNSGSPSAPEETDGPAGDLSSSDRAPLGSQGGPGLRGLGLEPEPNQRSALLVYGDLYSLISAILSWRRMHPENPSLEQIAMASRDVVLTESLRIASV